MFRPGKSGSVYSEGHDRIITLLSLLVQAGWEMILGKKKKNTCYFTSVTLFLFCGTCSFSLFQKMNVIKNERETGSSINDQANTVYNV